MSHKLEYRYKPGMVLRYSYTTFLQLDEPGQAPVTGKTVFCNTQTVLEEQDGKWTLEIQQELEEKEGPLCEHIDEGLANTVTVTRLDVTGRIFQADGSPGQTPGFPSEPLTEGQSWTVNDNGLTIKYLLERFETQPDGHIKAHISSLAQMLENDVQTDVRSHVVFSVSWGFQVSTQSLIQQRWTSGRLLQTVIELVLEPALKAR